MLKLDPRQRISPAEALSHPYFTGSDLSAYTSSPLGHPGRVAALLEEYQQVRPWRAVGGHRVIVTSRVHSASPCGVRDRCRLSPPLLRRIWRWRPRLRPWCRRNTDGLWTTTAATTTTSCPLQRRRERLACRARSLTPCHQRTRSRRLTCRRLCVRSPGRRRVDAARWSSWCRPRTVRGELDRRLRLRLRRQRQRRRSQSTSARTRRR